VRRGGEDLVEGGHDPRRSHLAGALPAVQHIAVIWVLPPPSPSFALRWGSIRFDVDSRLQEETAAWPVFFSSSTPWLYTGETLKPTRISIFIVYDAGTATDGRDSSGQTTRRRNTI
jgi:hypothetical protein